MVERTEHTVGGATEKMKEGARELGQAMQEKVMSQIEECQAETSNLIKENPYKSLLIAFGVGALFGMLMLRRD